MAVAVDTVESLFSRADAFRALVVQTRVTMDGWEQIHDWVLRIAVLAEAALLLSRGVRLFPELPEHFTPWRVMGQFSDHDPDDWNEPGRQSVNAIWAMGVRARPRSFSPGGVQPADYAAIAAHEITEALELVRSHAGLPRLHPPPAPPSPPLPPQLWPPPGWPAPTPALDTPTVFEPVGGAPLRLTLEWGGQQAFRFGRKRYVDLALLVEGVADGPFSVLDVAFEGMESPDAVIGSLVGFIDALWGDDGGVLRAAGWLDEFGLSIRATALLGRQVRFEVGGDDPTDPEVTWTPSPPKLVQVCDRDALAEALYRAWRRLALRWDDYAPRAAVNFAEFTSARAAERGWIEPLPPGMCPPPNDMRR